MAKPLREPPPTSSVARLFDPGAASRALSPIDHSGGRSQDGERESSIVASEPATVLAANPPDLRGRGTTPSHGEPANLKRELVLSDSTDQTLTRLLELYRRATGTRLSASHLARAMLRGIASCMDSVERESRQIGRLRLPSNARGRELDRERFEEILAEAFINGIRSAAAYRRSVS